MHSLWICDYYKNTFSSSLQIQWGGKIPEEMYMVRLDSDSMTENNNEDFVDEVIKKGTKLKLEFKVSEPGSVLKYEWL